MLDYIHSSAHGFHILCANPPERVTSFAPQKDWWKSGAISGNHLIPGTSICCCTSKGLSWTNGPCPMATIARSTSLVPCHVVKSLGATPLIAGFMGPTWGPPGLTGSRWAPCWPHEPCYLGHWVIWKRSSNEVQWLDFKVEHQESCPVITAPLTDQSVGWPSHFLIHYTLTFIKIILFMYVINWCIIKIHNRQKRIINYHVTTFLNIIRLQISSPYYFSQTAICVCILCRPNRSDLDIMHAAEMLSWEGNLHFCCMQFWGKNTSR